MNEIAETTTYEEAYAELEAVLASLETGDLSLEESLSRYELGAKLAAFCERKLDEAELRVRQWQQDGAAAIAVDFERAET